MVRNFRLNKRKREKSAIGCKGSLLRRLTTGTLSAVSLLWANSASAKCGGVDYSWGAQALAKQHDFVVTMMLYVLYLIYAIAAIVVIHASLQIYIKMNSGEDGIRKDIMMVIGACLFLIGASIVFPAFFGYRI